MCLPQGSPPPAATVAAIAAVTAVLRKTVKQPFQRFHLRQRLCPVPLSAAEQNHHQQVPHFGIVRPNFNSLP